ncbi:MAG: hypothetical protein GXP54_08190 [Deltaproteobacteria bacterium]|nr:hypothetical protein [Deltaproteobacteria bacterium]
MDDRDLRLDELAADVRELQRRVRTLEDQVSSIDVFPEIDRHEDDEAAGDETPLWTTGLPAIIGRTIMVFSGAFLLRAVTETGVMPDLAGIGVGLAYAAVWSWMADRAARAGRRMDAAFHGIATTMIAFPLLWEASTRFSVLGPWESAGAVMVFGGLLLGIAWLRGLGALAWVATLAATGTGVGLIFATHALTPYALAMFVLAAASLAASYHRGWAVLRWPAALALDVLVLLSMFLLGKKNYGWLDPWTVATIQLTLTAMYLGILAVRTLVLGHAMKVFGIVQSLVVLVVGFEGARYVMAAMGADIIWFHLIEAGLGAGCWVVCLLRLDRRPGERVNLAWYTTFGGLLIVLGLWRLVPDRLGGVPFALLALAGAWIGSHDHRKAVRWNAAVFVVAAAVVSGLAEGAALAFQAADPVIWFKLSPSALVVTALILAGWLTMRRDVSGERHTPDWTVPGLALLVTGAVGVGAALIAFLGPVVASLPGKEADLGALAVLRTVVLVLSALILAWIGRTRTRMEIVWTVYAVLAAAACKIAIEDLPNGRPVTIFLTLVLFGGALIVAPRLVKKPD